MHGCIFVLQGDQMCMAGGTSLHPHIHLTFTTPLQVAFSHPQLSDWEHMSIPMPDITLMGKQSNGSHVLRSSSSQTQAEYGITQTNSCNIRMSTYALVSPYTRQYQTWT